jgi:hypothetical protein
VRLAYGRGRQTFPAFPLPRQNPVVTAARVTILFRLSKKAFIHHLFRVAYQFHVAGASMKSLVDYCASLFWAT